MLLIVTIYAILATLSFIYVETKLNKPLLAWYFKAHASFGFILVFAAALYSRAFDHGDLIVNLPLRLDMLQVVIFILLGLVMGLLGDLVLALRPLQDKIKDKTIIIFGITFFAVGHIFYIFALIRHSDFGFLSTILGVVMTLFIYVMSKLMKFEMEKAKIPTLIYTFLIFMMVGQAIDMGIQKDFNTFSMLLVSGAVLFAISDLILAPIYYKSDNRKWMIALNLATYYAAQLLIALSIYYFL